MRPIDLYDEHLYAVSIIKMDLPPYSGCAESCPHKHNRTPDERAAAVYLSTLTPVGRTEARELLFPLADGSTVTSAVLRRQILRMLPLWEALAGVS